MNTEPALNTELPCSEKDEVVKNRNFKGDAELISCLAIDDVFTIAAKIERDIVELSDTVITFTSIGSIVTMVENVSYTKLPVLEKGTSCH